MIVVDVNIIAYLWIPGEMTPYAEAVLHRDPHWVSCFLWRSEFRNILAGYLRRGQLTSIQVERCLYEAEWQMAGHEYFIPSSLVMNKVTASSCTAYDCEYVALADDLKTILVTCDGKLLKEFPELTVSIKKYANKGV